MSRSNYGKKQRWRQQLPELAELAAWERPTIATPEDILIEREEAEQLYRAMERLPARYERVLRLHNGINCAPLTFEQIAGQLGNVCRGRVQQIEQKSCLLMIRPLLGKFRDRPGAQRIRREMNDATREAARQVAVMAAQRAADEMRSEAECHNALIDAAVQREQSERALERERERQRTVAEILRIAEEVELELDNIPRQRRQRVVNPFGFSAERAAEYAAVLRGMVRV